VRAAPVIGVWLRTAGLVAVLFSATAIAGCGGTSSTSTVLPTATPMSFPTATPTFVVPSRAVPFSTSDHILLAGILVGHGTTFVLFSNQTDTLAAEWTPVAQQFAARGYAALCYDYRGRGQSQGQRDVGPSLMTDLRGAMAFAQEQGARRIVLIGASLGGTVTANVAATVSVAAVVLISAPQSFAGPEVSDATVQAIAAPKFFVDSTGDNYAQDIQAMYDAAKPPKVIHWDPGVDHGLDLLTGYFATAGMQHLLAFVQSYAPA
jgi:pimeloyl-ACP methyl ester carboxylesterase